MKHKVLCPLQQEASEAHVLPWLPWLWAAVLGQGTGVSSPSPAAMLIKHARCYAGSLACIRC